MRWLVVLPLVAGCFHDPAPAPPANRTPAPRGASQDILAYLPADSDVVVVLDAAQIRATGLWQGYQDVLTKGAIREVKERCGIDLAATQRIALALHMPPGGGSEAVVVVRGLPRGAFMKCAADPTKVADKRWAVSGNVITVTEGPQAAVAAFVDDNTLVVRAKTGANAAALDAVVRSGSPLRGSRPFVDMFTHTDTGAALWFIVRGESRLFDSFKSLGYPLKGASGSIRTGDEFGISARVLMESPTAAQQLAATLKAQVAPLQPFVDSFDVADEDDGVKIEIKITEAQVERLIQMMGLARSLGGP
jgi:hypothetical protein